MVVHDLGALLFFLFGVAYAVIQSVISYRGLPYGSSKCMCLFRAFFAAVACLAVLPSILSQSYQHVLLFDIMNIV